jgi:hypothetical protein
MKGAIATEGAFEGEAAKLVDTMPFDSISIIITLRRYEFNDEFLVLDLDGSFQWSGLLQVEPPLILAIHWECGAIVISLYQSELEVTGLTFLLMSSI